MKVIIIMGFIPHRAQGRKQVLINTRNSDYFSSSE